ncbi:MAG TPA: 1,2-phenylacetyl-CoA epoxidase subunit PaaD [Casimicrobiaceae bacterium]|nr:1,2-phenylacetyl-CoA epoxidase subunit PaaD [Casimicrobiaceae bacterium]
MVTREQEALAAAVAKAERPSWRSIWSALADVPDPEIPVLSVLDLGVVRGAEWDPVEPEVLVVRVTPTYSGCPATEVIIETVRQALADIGVRNARIETMLSPPWSSSWLSAHAQRRLSEYGIAPPGSATIGAPVTIDVRGLAPLRNRSLVPCPRCGSTRTELVAPFGSTACKAQYRCADCLEPFDFFKPI